MPWNDRIKQGTYQSPEGNTIVFQSENVSKTFDKQTAAFNFPDGSGTLVQDNGATSKRYPLRIFFWGDDHDLEAEAFESALRETGAGILTHPFYNVDLNVVPFGQVHQRDDLKTAANQTIFEVTFWETVPGAFLSAQKNAPSEVITSIDEFNESLAEEFAENLQNDTIGQQAQAAGVYTSLLNGAKSGLKSVADVQQDVASAFETVSTSINDGIDVLIGKPLTLAFQTAIMMQLPARAADLITARLSAYRDLLDSILGKGTYIPDLDSSNANEYQSNRVYATTAITGSILSVVNNQFETKAQALSAAEEIQAQMDSFTAWQDLNNTSLSVIDTGGAYQQLTEAVSIATGFLVEISFTLKQERTITLGGPRSIIDLCAELYGVVDEKLDFFISSNDLSGAEILEIPRGRQIVYFV